MLSIYYDTNADGELTGSELVDNMDKDIVQLEYSRYGRASYSVPYVEIP